MLEGLTSKTSLIQLKKWSFEDYLNIKVKIQIFNNHYNSKLYFEYKGKIFLWKPQIFNLQLILEGIFYFWLQILLKNIGLFTSWYTSVDMIYGSYFATIIWKLSLNYYFKLRFIIHLHNFGNMDYCLVLNSSRPINFFTMEVFKELSHFDILATWMCL